MAEAKISEVSQRIRGKRRTGSLKNYLIYNREKRRFYKIINGL
jgi:hypothetical protein